MAEAASLLAARPLPDEPVAGSPAEARPPRRHLRDVVPALGLYAASRLAVLVASIPAALHANVGAGPWPVIRGGSSLERVFTQWDGAWYIWVADRGYPTTAQYRHRLSDVAFFPAFPALLRGFASFTGLLTLNVAALRVYML